MGKLGPQVVDQYWVIFKSLRTRCRVLRVYLSKIFQSPCAITCSRCPICVSRFVKDF